MRSDLTISFESFHRCKLPLALNQKNYEISKKYWVSSMLRASMYSSRSPINLFPSDPLANAGLLSAVNDISSANVPLSQTYELINNNRFLCDIIENECKSDHQLVDKYLEDVEFQMGEFIVKKLFGVGTTFYLGWMMLLVIKVILFVFSVVRVLARV